MDIKLTDDKLSGNFIEQAGCYEVELIKNTRPCDTSLRIELMDNDFLNISISELEVLKELLNSQEFKKLVETVQADNTFVSIAKQYEEHDDIKDRIRGLHSSGELSDFQYEYIITEWDSILRKNNL